VLRAWCFVLGAWCLVLGAWCLVRWKLILPNGALGGERVVGMLP
jgi:hypothetical protein